jgi:carboxymethylenebutenolidase
MPHEFLTQCKLEFLSLHPAAKEGLMPSTKSFASRGKPVDAEVFDPSGTPNGGFVVIAYGSDGMTDHLNGPWATMIRGYAADLAQKGFTALVPDYFGSTGTQPGPGVFEQIPVHRDAWEATLSDAVSYAQTLPGVDAARVGLIGFSLGGHLCLRLRASAKVLVEFFAPVFDGVGSRSTPTLQVQIHHGEADGLVPLTPNAARIEQELRAEGASVELFAYRGAGHGFIGQDTSNANARAQSQSRTIAFFDAYL